MQCKLTTFNKKHSKNNRVLFYFLKYRCMNTINKDFGTGLFLIFCGLFFGIYSLQYTIGSFSSMGPGFFPLILSIFVLLFGFVILFRSRYNPKISNYHIRIPLLLFLILLITGILADHLGLLIGMGFLMITSAMLHKKFRLIPTVVSTAIFSIILIILKFTFFPTLPL